MFWLHCNHCGARPARNPPVRFVLSNCRHVLCSKCSSGRQSCPQCSNKKFRVIDLDQSMPAKYQKLFKSPMTELSHWQKLITRASEFQKKQNASLAVSLRKTQSTLFYTQQHNGELQSQQEEFRQEIKKYEATKEQNTDLRERIRHLESLLTKKLNHIPTEDICISESFLQLPPEFGTKTGSQQARGISSGSASSSADPNASVNQSLSSLFNDVQAKSGRASGRLTDSAGQNSHKDQTSTKKQTTRLMLPPEKRASKRSSELFPINDEPREARDSQLLNFTQEVITVNNSVSVVRSPNKPRTTKSGGLPTPQDPGQRSMLSRENPVVVATFNQAKRSKIDAQSLGGSVKGKINQRITKLL